jgi:hypothetical protein
MHLHKIVAGLSRIFAPLKAAAEAIVKQLGYDDKTVVLVRRSGCESKLCHFTGI